MHTKQTFSYEQLHYLRLLSKQYPTVQAAGSEIIKLRTVLNLPKGTEHFMSDIHGEYEAFLHILNSGSGEIREKLVELFDGVLSQQDIDDLATLIYYPKAKLAMIMMMAWYLSKFSEKITDNSPGGHPIIWGFGGSCCVFGLIAGLVALEHHISGTIIVAGIGVVMMFVGRVNMKYLFIAGGILAVAAVCLIAFSSYGGTRIEVWKMVLFDPHNIPKDIARDQAYQNLQGLYAIGSGGFFGVGLGNSFQKSGYVSQPQNDFIFSIICEELGFVGAAAVMLLFMGLAWRGYLIARNAPDLYSSLLVFGIVTQVTMQAILNIGVVTALIPNTGISLPFFSSGGTSLVILMVEMGIVLSISRYSYQKRS